MNIIRPVDENKLKLLELSTKNMNENWSSKFITCCAALFFIIFAFCMGFSIGELILYKGAITGNVIIYSCVSFLFGLLFILLTLFS